jgi:esterase/lipase
MANLEDLGEVISTDVLVVGGGIGGSVAGISVKEASHRYFWICCASTAKKKWHACLNFSLSYIKKRY